MTTPKPAALPELPEPFALSVSVHEGDTPAKTYVECMLYQKHPDEKQHLYTADQMRAYALAALQAQPAAAGVSDAEIERVARSHGTGGWQTLPDMIRFTRAILALRPQSESEARRAAQEQLYTERERHTAEVKRLQAEIGRLQSLRHQAVPMTDEQRDAAWKRADERYFAQGTNRIPFAHLLINEVEAHHHIGIAAPAGGEEQA